MSVTGGDMEVRAGEPGLLEVLRDSLTELGDAVAGEAGRKVAMVRASGPIATLVRKIVALVVAALEALTKVVVKIEAWTLLVDAARALLEVLGDSLATTARASTAIVGDMQAMFGADEPPAGANPLISALEASSKLVTTLADALGSEKVAAVMPGVADLRAVSRELGCLLGQDSRDPDAPSRSLFALAAAIEPRPDDLARASARTKPTVTKEEKHD